MPEFIDFKVSRQGEMRRISWNEQSKAPSGKSGIPIIIIAAVVGLAIVADLAAGSDFRGPVFLITLVVIGIPAAIGGWIWSNGSDQKTIESEKAILFDDYKIYFDGRNYNCDDVVDVVVNSDFSNRNEDVGKSQIRILFTERRYLTVNEAFWEDDVNEELCRLIKEQIGMPVPSQLPQP